MTLTSQDTLRKMILLTLSQAPEGAMARADALNAINDTWRSRWTEDDLSSPRTRPHESNWRNRASYERARMIREGLLDVRADGTWSLTEIGLAEAARIIRPEDELAAYRRTAAGWTFP